MTSNVHKLREIFPNFDIFNTFDLHRRLGDPSSVFTPFHDHMPRVYLHEGFGDIDVAFAFLCQVLKNTSGAVFSIDESDTIQLQLVRDGGGQN